MESVVREGLENQELRDLVADTIAIDTFQPKLGAEEETIVTTFKVIQYEPPAQDLAQFIEQGAYDILDVEVSPSSLCSFAAIFLNIRLIIFPERVLGNAGEN